MPREIRDIKAFLTLAARPDTRYVKIKKNPSATKFKVRCSRFLHTLTMSDSKKATRLEQSIHPSVKKILVSSRSHAALKAKK